MDNNKKFYTGSLDLMKYPGAVFGKINGKDHICIPTDNPTIYVGSKGIYLNLFVSEVAQPNSYGNSHMICATVSKKEDRESMSDADKDLYCPIVGNLKSSLKDSMQAQAVSLDTGGSVQVFPSKDDNDLPAGTNTQAPSSSSDRLPWEQ